MPLAIRWHSKFFDFATPDFWMPDESTIRSTNFVTKIGQAIYTPTDFTRSDVILDDRPYAGIIFAGLSMHQRYKQPASSFEVLDMREITLGVIGPLSFSREFQDGIHSIYDDVHFKGWDNQLKNEPAFQVAFDKKFKKYQGSWAYLPGYDADFIESFGVRAGNIETSVNANIEGRFGWDITNDFGSLTIRPGSDSRPPDLDKNQFTSKELETHPHLRPTHFGFHFFSILDVKYVAYNFSVDGNLFEDSHKVTRQPWVTFGAIGIALPTLIKKYGYNLSIMQVYETSDFKERNAHHAYQAVALSIEL